MKNLSAFIFILLSLLSCDFSVSEVSDVLSVSEYEVTLNGKPAVYVKFGSNEEDSCMLGVLKESVQKNYRVEIQGSSSLSVNVDLTCTNDSGYYLISSSSDTYIKLDVEELSDSHVTYQIVSRLVSAGSKKYFDLDGRRLTISGKDFSILRK